MKFRVPSYGRIRYFELVWTVSDDNALINTIDAEFMNFLESKIKFDYVG